MRNETQIVTKETFLLILETCIPFVNLRQGFAVNTQHEERDTYSHKRDLRANKKDHLLRIGTFLRTDTDSSRHSHAKETAKLTKETDILIKETYILTKETSKTEIYPHLLAPAVRWAFFFLIAYSVRSNTFIASIFCRSVTLIRNG